jgi:hypothetical protein
MTQEDQVFVANVVVINLTWETMASSVISRLIGAVAELSIIIKIRKYKKLQERHLFISMVMEVHGAPRHDMDSFIKECTCLFHDRQSKGHLSLSFCIQFFKHVNIIFERALAFAIKRKFALASDVCSKPRITSRSHDLHASDIKGDVNETTSYHEKN